MFSVFAIGVPRRNENLKRGALYRTAIRNSSEPSDSAAMMLISIFIM
jgi:hypothetical protein